jgi:hypothetical protein
MLRREEGGRKYAYKTILEKKKRPTLDAKKEEEEEKEIHKVFEHT